MAYVKRARPLVEPERKIFGREAEGLALARLARQLAADDLDRARASDAQAWALFALGQDDEARRSALKQEWRGYRSSRRCGRRISQGNNIGTKRCI